MRPSPVLFYGLLGLSVWILFGEPSEAAIGEPPAVFNIDPPPGFVQALHSVSVTFNEPVTGVRAGDFLVNGIPADSVAGGGAAYVFAFPQPAYGPVDITWGTLHSIVNLQDPPQRFDGGTAGSTWAYELSDPAGPALTSTVPAPGTRLRQLSQVEVMFSRPVTGIAASSLRLGGVGATNLTGLGAGPYRFFFSEAAPGEATVSWDPAQPIITDDPSRTVFQGTPWTYQVNPGQSAPELIINEIMAENQTGLQDEDKDPEDWIELYNRGTEPVNLEGWSLSVDREDEGQWVFPSTSIAPGGYLLVWASGKDRRDSVSQRYHTNFKLNPNGDTLRLFGPELPRTIVDELSYPEQSPNHAYGRQVQDTSSVWRFFVQATPGGANGLSTITGKVDEVHFSVQRGFFNAPFSLSLACPTAGSEIRYSLDGSPPTLTNAVAYTEPIMISNTRVVRAVAFAPGRLPSGVRTHTYLMNLANNRRLLPVLSLVTATNNLYGRSGIMEYSPRNTTKHGAAWERPVSAEWIQPGDNSGFQLDAGLRVAGGDYIRGRYNYRQSSPPEGKYSFRLYFRGDYGPGQLNYPIFPASTLGSYNTLHLRAGMNDPTNPFLKDEFVRELSLDVGITACHGTFVYLFLNGVYKGLYNPTERVDDDFLQAYHGGGELWDVIGPANLVIRGDATAWNQLRTAVRKDLTIASNYVEVARRMDLANFIDYLLPLIWADNDDWPHNNTRAARERKPGAPFRFYPWDAEFAFGSHPVSYDTIANTLSTLSPPWGSTDYQAMFNSLKKSPEFRLLFADRVHRAFYNNGPLTDARIRARYNSVKAQVAPSIPGFSDSVGAWINARRRYLTNIVGKAGFLASSNAPSPSQFGGAVPNGYALTLGNLSGTIYYTTNETDPRTPFLSKPSSGALTYTGPLKITQPMHLLARSLDGTNWSALLDVAFQVSQVGSPLRITELMYNPPGGDAFEYLELQNTGGLPLDLSGCSFQGIRFRFPVPFPELGPGERIVLANDARPADFRSRYPNVTVAGWFGGALANDGERIALLDPAGATLTAVEYKDEYPWPKAADGQGASLESSDPLGNTHDPGNWHSSAPGGSPALVNLPAAPPAVRLNELHAGSERDWIELYNPGSDAVSLANWSLSDNSDPRQFVLPAGTRIASQSFLRIDCAEGTLDPAVAPFQLDRFGETISLFDANTNRVDAVQFGSVVDGYTVGRVSGGWELCDPTPLAENLAAQTGALSTVRINELLANSDAEDDWIEFHNSGTLPVALRGCALSVSNTVARVEVPTFIAAGGFLALRADEHPGPDHLDLRLPAAGTSIALLGPDGAELDRVAYGPQPPGVSMGRLPDGSGEFQQLPFSPTRGASNYLAELGARLRVAEFLARSSTGPDWIEIENVHSTALSLNGFRLGVKAPGQPLARWTFRPETSLAPGERLLAYFGGQPSGVVLPANAHVFSLPLPDDTAVLTLRDALDRTVDRVEYGPQLLNRSVGRVNQAWALLSALSPGQPNGPAAALDSGADLRINEWLAGGGGTNDFIELYNPAALPLDLGGWTLTDDPSISGSTNNLLRPLTFIDAHGFLQFHADGDAADRLDHTGFQVDRLGETIRLLSPSGGIVDTLDLLVQVEAVSEGRLPDGNSAIVRFAQPTPGAPNSVNSLDADHDGMDDAWELLHGLNPASAKDADQDADADGASNLQEFLAGTDPRNAESLLELSVVAIEPAGLKLGFAAQPGRSYIVQYSDGLFPATWTTLISVPPAAAIGERVVTDPTPVAQRPTRFYRVMAER